MNHTPENQCELDLTGLYCPQPILHTKKKMASIYAGEQLLVKATDPSYVVDLGVYIRKSGHTLLNSWQEGDINFYLIQAV